jgi:hypothetical protein
MALAPCKLRAVPSGQIRPVGRFEVRRPRGLCPNGRVAKLGPTAGSSARVGVRRRQFLPPPPPPPFGGPPPPLRRGGTSAEGSAASAVRRLGENRPIERSTTGIGSQAPPPFTGEGDQAQLGGGGGARANRRGPLIRPSATFSHEGRRVQQQRLRPTEPLGSGPSPLMGEGGRRPDEGGASATTSQGSFTPQALQNLNFSSSPRRGEAGAQRRMKGRPP